MKINWNDLNERERWMLGSGLVCCFFYLYYLILFAPLSKAVHDASQQFIEKKETLAWMQQVRKQYQVKKAPQTLTTSKLLTVLASQLNHSSFKQFPYQLQQTGANDIQLIFDAVPYNGFITWLWSVNERYVISIKQFSVEKSETPGVVKMTLILSSLK